MASAATFSAEPRKLVFYAKDPSAFALTLPARRRYHRPAGSTAPFCNVVGRFAVTWNNNLDRDRRRALRPQGNHSSGAFRYWRQRA